MDASRSEPPPNHPDASVSQDDAGAKLNADSGTKPDIDAGSRAGAAGDTTTANDTDAGSTPDICAANCSSRFASLHNFDNATDATAIVGRWLVCAQESLAPTDQAGVEFTSDGHFIILRRDSAGKIVRGTGNDARPTYAWDGGNNIGGFELRMTFAPYSQLAGDLSDCPKRLRLRDILAPTSGPLPSAEYIFDTGVEPEGCTFPSNGCDYCGKLICPPNTSADSSCRCQQDFRIVRPESQTCDFCCGKKCEDGQFLDYHCECYSSPLLSP